MTSPSSDFSPGVHYRPKAGEFSQVHVEDSYSVSSEEQISTMGNLCGEIFKKLEHTFDKINQCVGALTPDFGMLSSPKKVTAPSIDLRHSPLRQRHKRRGFELKADLRESIPFIRKILSISASVLFGYESAELRNLQAEQKKLIKKINEQAQKLRRTVHPQVKTANSLYSVMCKIVGWGHTGRVDPGQGQDCVNAGSHFAASMKKYRVGLIVINVATLLTALTSCSILFKLGLLACTAYVIFMFIMYAKQVMDMKTLVDTLQQNIQLAKELMKGEVGQVLAWPLL